MGPENPLIQLTISSNHHHVGRIDCILARQDEPSLYGVKNGFVNRRQKKKRLKNKST